MLNLAEKYILLDCAEKVYRLDNFIVENVSRDRTSSNRAIIEIFEKALQELKTYMSQTLPYFTRENNDPEKFALLRKLSTLVRSIYLLHDNLRYLHSGWLRPETFTFVEKILDHIPNLRQNGDINIILSDNYSFFETNLSKKFDDITNRLDIIGGHKTIENVSSPTIVLPKMEFMNPLNWSILIHELGHTNRVRIQELLQMEGLFPDSATVEQRDILMKWAEEIYCDLFATTLIGPAYYLSLASFALTNSLDIGMNQTSPTHPPFGTRLSLIYRFVQKNSDFKAKFFNETNKSVLNLVNEMIQNVDEIFISNGIPIRGVEIRDLTQFFSFLSDHCVKQDDMVAVLTEQAISDVNSLVERLKDGIPIGSIRKQIETKTMIERLTQAPPISIDEFNDMKGALTERSTELWEIMIGGWIYKMQQVIPKGFEIFLGNTSDEIGPKLEAYGRLIAQLDDRLLKSIETARLIEVIEN